MRPLPEIDVTPVRRPIVPAYLIHAENVLVLVGWALLVGAVVAGLTP